MLQAIREKAQGWIAWAIVALISIPFALWGIQEYLGVGGEVEVAVVDGDAITQRMLDDRVRDFRELQRARLGDLYDADLFEDSLLKPQVLDAMVEERVLVNGTRDWNLRTSDAKARGYIASIPGFQRDGRFDGQLYEDALRNRGMSRTGFEQSIRQDLVVDQFRSAVRDSAFITESDLKTRIRLLEEQRSFAFVRVPADKYRGALAPDSDQLRAYYDANLDRYRTPERVKVNYLVLDAATLSGLVEVSDASLRQYFQDHRAEFLGREERAMRHILVAVPPGASDDEADKAKAEATDLVRQIREGADFAELAKSHSDDPGSASSGGDLGWVEQGMMVAPFEEAAFALGEGQVSDVVRTEYGFHVIQVTAVRGGSNAQFEDVRDKVEAAYRKLEAENLYFDHAERLAELAYENASSLAPAAEALALDVRETDWLSRDAAMPAPLNSPKVANAIFSDDVLGEGHNSELIEVGPQLAVVVRIADHEPAGAKAFDQHVSSIEADYVHDMASQEAARVGRQLLDEMKAGGKRLADVAEAHDWAVQRPGAVGRDSDKAPPEVLSAAFAVEPPEPSRPGYTGVVSAEGDFMLIEVASVEAGQLEALPEAERKALVDRAKRLTANAQLDALTQSLRNRASIEIRAIGD